MNDLQRALCYTMPLRLTAPKIIQPAKIHHSLPAGFPSNDCPDGLHNSTTASCGQAMLPSPCNRLQPEHLSPAISLASSRRLCTTEAVNSGNKILATSPTSLLLVLKRPGIFCQRTHLTQISSTGVTIHLKRVPQGNEPIGDIDGPDTSFARNT